MPLKMNGSTSGYTQIQAAAVAGNNTLNLPTSGTNLLADNGSGALTIQTINSGTSNALTLQSNNTTAMTIDTSQNVGIGTSSPSTFGKLAVVGQTTKTIGVSITSNGTTASPVETNLLSSSSAGSYESGIYSVNTYSSNYGNGLTFKTTDTAGTTAERMRINSSGNLLVGTTSNGLSNSSSFTFEPGNQYSVFNKPNGSSSGSYYIYFGYNAGTIGSITQNGTTGVLYNITSDYRLKDNATKITNGIETIQKLNPVTFTWKSDDSEDSGFIAHEFQSVIPRSVTGEKDAVDADGKPVYQGMDNSGAVPYLVAAIQELTAEVTALKAKVGV